MGAVLVERPKYPSRVLNHVLTSDVWGVLGAFMNRRYCLEIKDKASIHQAWVERDEWHPIRLFDTLTVEIDGKSRLVQVNRVWHPVVVDGKIQLGLACRAIDYEQRKFQS